MIRLILLLFLAATLPHSIIAQKDASHYFVLHPEGTTIKVFATQKFHGDKTVEIKGKAYYFSTDETGEFWIDTNYYWEDDEYFYKYYPIKDYSDNFLPKKVHAGQEWTGKSGKHKFRIEKTLDEMTIGEEDSTTYHDVIHVVMDPVQEDLYAPYHFFYAREVGLIKMVHETNEYELQIISGSVQEVTED